MGEYTEICSCEGCFKQADSNYRMMGVEFSVCEDHNTQFNTTHNNLIIEPTISEALEYRDEIMAFNQP